MLFFFKEKPVEIVAYTSDDFITINERTPVKLAREYFPDWWKNTPSSSFNWEHLKVKTTSKSCPGIGHTLQKGLILPMWSDLAIKTQDIQFQWQFADNKSIMGIHSNDEVPEFYNDYFIFKLHSPWLFKSTVPLLYTSPFYLFTSPPPYIIPTGIVTPVNNLCGSNIFILTKKTQEESRYMIKQSTPMLHIIPLTEKNIKLRTEVISVTEMNKLRNYTAYRNHFTARGLKNMQ
jgi:hypothetical protein